MRSLCNDSYFFYDLIWYITRVQATLWQENIYPKESNYFLRTQDPVTITIMTYSRHKLITVTFAVGMKLYRKSVHVQIL